MVLSDWLQSWNACLQGADGYDGNAPVFGGEGSGFAKIGQTLGLLCCEIEICKFKNNISFQSPSCCKNI